MIRILLPSQLQLLAHTGAEIQLVVEGRVTLRAVLDALETAYPMLKGAIIDHETRRRRPLIRFFACGRDLSHDPVDTCLPDALTSGAEPLRIVGAIAGG